MLSFTKNILLFSLCFSFLFFFSCRKSKMAKAPPQKNQDSSQKISYKNETFYEAPSQDFSSSSSEGEEVLWRPINQAPPDERRPASLSYAESNNVAPNYPSYPDNPSAKNLNTRRDNASASSSKGSGDGSKSIDFSSSNARDIPYARPNIDTCDPELIELPPQGQALISDVENITSTDLYCQKIKDSSVSGRKTFNDGNTKEIYIVSASWCGYCTKLKEDLCGKLRAYQNGRITIHVLETTGGKTEADAILASRGISGSWSLSGYPAVIKVKNRRISGAEGHSLPGARGW